MKTFGIIALAAAVSALSGCAEEVQETNEEDSAIEEGSHLALLEQTLKLVPDKKVDGKWSRNEGGRCYQLLMMGEDRAAWRMHRYTKGAAYFRKGIRGRKSLKCVDLDFDGRTIGFSGTGLDYLLRNNVGAPVSLAHPHESQYYSAATFERGSLSMDYKIVEYQPFFGEDSIDHPSSVGAPLIGLWMAVEDVGYLAYRYANGKSDSVWPYISEDRVGFREGGARRDDVREENLSLYTHRYSRVDIHRAQRNLVHDPYYVTRRTMEETLFLTPKGSDGHEKEKALVTCTRRVEWGYDGMEPSPYTCKGLD